MCAGKVGRTALKSNIEERLVPMFSTAKRMARRDPGGFLIGVEDAVNTFVVLLTIPTSITRPVRSMAPFGFDTAAPVPIGNVLLVCVPAVCEGGVYTGGTVVTTGRVVVGVCETALFTIVTVVVPVRVETDAPFGVKSIKSSASVRELFDAAVRIMALFAFKKLKGVLQKTVVSLPNALREVNDTPSVQA